METETNRQSIDVGESSVEFLLKKFGRIRKFKFDSPTPRRKEVTSYRCDVTN